MTGEFIFVLGRASQLAFFELQTFFPQAELTTEGIARVQNSNIKNPQEVIARLGGTIKVAELVGDISEVTAEALTGALERISSGSMTFGVSSYTPGFVPNQDFLSRMKDLLVARGRHARYILAKNGELSSVVVAKEKLVELIVLPKTAGKFRLYQTVAVQEFEQWSKRDYDRPFADAKAGMLPPKVARMAVNLARSSADWGSRPGILLDPFCGMGTVLAEAAMTGWDVIGADIDPVTVEKAQKNLEWLRREYTLSSSFQFITVDAVHISQKLPSESVDAIVTEPFLGTTALGDAARKIPFEKAKNIVKGLEKLYIGCLKDWHRVLKKGAKVVIAIPKFQVEDKILFVKRVVDSCENFGYTRQHGPLEYGRPQAKVKREFFIFQKK